MRALKTCLTQQSFDGVLDDSVMPRRGFFRQCIFFETIESRFGMTTQVVNKYVINLSAALHNVVGKLT